MYAYFIDILQGSVETRSRCGGIYNNHIIANCLRSVPVKEFLNWSIFCEDMDKSKVARFYGPPCRCVWKTKSQYGFSFKK